MNLRASFQIPVFPLYLLIALAAQGDAQQPNIQENQHSKVILGVLEDHSGNYAGDANFQVVRAIFEKQGKEWRPFQSNCSTPECLKLLPKSYPDEVRWTITFDGKRLGWVDARTPANFHFYSQAGIEYIISANVIPTVGKREREYSGFAGESVYRPLVAVSQPNFKDPDGWKPAQPSPEQIDTVRREFRKKFPTVSNCKDPNENKLESWKYNDKDIKVESAYTSKTGWSLVEIDLTGYACDGLVDDGGPFDGQWYVFQPSGKVQFLGSDMWLVDAGDYDGDLQSEVLFAVVGYNLGGYRLFYQDFSRSAEFLFSYH
jgi:hypothetical protein